MTETELLDFLRQLYRVAGKIEGIDRCADDIHSAIATYVGELRIAAANVENND